MLLMNEEWQARTVADRYREQYRDNCRDWSKPWLACGESPQSMHARLVALGERPTPEAIAGVIGNSTWCAPKECNECERESWDVVLIGADPDYDSATALVCVDCLRGAVALVESPERAESGER